VEKWNFSHTSAKIFSTTACEKKQWKIEKPVEKMIGKSYPQIVLHFPQKIVDKSQRKKFIAVCL
jgi:hypothetical protein